MTGEKEPSNVVEIQPEPFEVLLQFEATEMFWTAPERLTRRQAEHVLIAAFRVVQTRSGLDPWKLLEEL